MTQVPQTTWNRQQWSIINAQGKPWTPLVWGTEDAAKSYLEGYRGYNPTMNLKKHRVVPVSITIRAIGRKK